MRFRHPAAIALSAVFLLFGILVLAAQAAAQAGGPRFALVIGNGNYSELGRLKNPANDAADMGKALTELGFKVRLLVDADLPSMEDAVVRLGSDLAVSADSVGFFFYAGHGVQAGGTNYLIPADARIASEAFLKNKALPAQSVLDTLQGARNALNIVVLDACRDNPFSWGRSTARGLTVVGSQPTGSIVAYATSAGSVAQDGTGRNGVFTAELLKQIRTPGLEIKDVFNRTGKGVSTVTAGKQVPAVYNQFFDSAYLAGGQGAAVGSAPAASAPAVATTMTVTRGYGSMVVSAATAGSLYLDGKSLGELPAGAEARLDNNVEVGDRLVELRYAGGGKESKSVRVEKGSEMSVAFVWKPSAAKKPAAAPATQTNALSIGDTHAGGIVFYLDGRGGGLVAAPTNQKGSFPWLKAKELCGNLDLNGFRDWYLPTKDELDLMYNNLKKQGRGGLGSAWYWSSSERGNGLAWEQVFDDGRQVIRSKTSTGYIRAVRAFNN